MYTPQHTQHPHPSPASKNHSHYRLSKNQEYSHCFSSGEKKKERATEKRESFVLRTDYLRGMTTAKRQLKQVCFMFAYVVHVCQTLTMLLGLMCVYIPESYYIDP
jgi:hypothetical protein